MSGIHKDYCRPGIVTRLLLQLRGPACVPVNRTHLTERERALPQGHKFQGARS